jgi:hypothetical protein
MAEVVDLRPAEHACGSKARAVYGTTRAYFYIVFNYHVSDLREVLQRTMASPHETEASTSDDCIGF